MGSGTLTGAGWVVDEIDGSIARLATDPLTGMKVLIGPEGDFLVVSSAAPSNGDGRPNGTIYIQTV